MLFLSFVLGAVAVGAAATATEPSGLPLTGREATGFLRTAELVGRPERFDALAITEPVRVELTDHTRTLRAIFKQVDTSHMVFRFADGRVLTKVKDSYKHEIAAYELDSLLGLGIVPPCVEREIQGQIGSLCLWVENAMTESQRKRRKIVPPDARAWNRQMYTIRLFHQLIWDPDFNNTSNILVDSNFKLYKVDSSLGFRKETSLRNEKSLSRFSRRVVHRLEGLQRSDLDDRLGRWLDPEEIEALWQRRCRLLELVHENVTAHGEVAVFFE